MTVMQAQAYFSTRLHTNSWDNAFATEKEKALAQAERDISNLPLNNVPAIRRSHAIYEQALFLLSLTPADLKRYKAHALGVSYRQIDRERENYEGTLQFIAPQAQAMLQGYMTRHRRMGGIR